MPSIRLPFHSTLPISTALHCTPLHFTTVFHSITPTNYYISYMNRRKERAFAILQDLCFFCEPITFSFFLSFSFIHTYIRTYHVLLGSSYYLLTTLGSPFLLPSFPIEYLHPVGVLREWVNFGVDPRLPRISVSRKEYELYKAPCTFLP